MKQILHFSFVCAAYLAPQTNLLAQGQLVEGYIITNQNDTIHGLIKDEGWTRSPETIQLKVKNGPLQTFSADDTRGFGISATNEIYKSKKIGLLNITLTQMYLTAPFLETKDSAQVFLQEIVTGSRATLYEFLNASEQPHYFLEKGNLLKELYYYPFHKSINDRAYLLVYDEYKKQLTRLCVDADGFKAYMPPYQRKYLKQYIEKYNDAFSRDYKLLKSENRGVTFDVDVNIALENWNQPPVVLTNKFTYGFGLRVNFPRKFRNRYLKFNIFTTPDAMPRNNATPYEEIPLTTLEIAVGSHFGAGKIRPYLGFQYSGVHKGRRPDFVGFQTGVSYKRRFYLEIGHFANFNVAISKSKLFTPPRISLHYMINFNSTRGKIL
ncbi:MAG: hypothetical protein ABIN80_08580 [Dyadobacter sp.]|uniref:hypothetical protein n=1 Tax=Dyadobacter sp. TaxID=1914288 RepID=UPI0032672F11